MNALRAAVERYVCMRRGLGHKFQHQERRLKEFVAFMEDRGASIITRSLALEWATLPSGRHSSWKLRLTDVRGFARHLACIEERTEVPAAGILPPLRRSKPYLYNDDEVEKLLTAALTLRPVGGLRRWTYNCLFGLLTVTGLRISETLRLRRDDVDLEQGILTIRGTKFGKSRLVPLHPTTCNVLLNYAARRDENPARRTGSYFFAGERGGPLIMQNVQVVFWQLSRQIGLRCPTDHTGPRLHDFRHRFAVETLLRAYRSGGNVELCLPLVSTWLGHSCVRDTYWYLSACPELMEYAAKRLEARWEAAS